MRQPGYHPAHAYLEAGPARPGRIRRQTADRMKALRARLAEEGRPDAASLDRAIVDALRDAIARTVRDGSTQGGVFPEEIVVGVAEHLRKRAVRAKKAGRKAVVYRPEAVGDAIYQRILAVNPSRPIYENGVSFHRSNGGSEDLPEIVSCSSDVGNRRPGITSKSR